MAIPEIDIQHAQLWQRLNLLDYYLLINIKLLLVDNIPQEFGWYAHPLFRDRFFFHEGVFRVELFAPEFSFHQDYRTLTYKR